MILKSWKKCSSKQFLEKTLAQLTFFFLIWGKGMSQGLRPGDYDGYLTCTSISSLRFFWTKSLSEMYLTFVAPCNLAYEYDYIQHQTKYLFNGWRYFNKFYMLTGKQLILLSWEAQLSCLSNFYGSTLVSKLSEWPSYSVWKY